MGDKDKKKILRLPIDFDNQNISIGSQRFAATLQKFEPFQEKVGNTGEATYKTPVTHLNMEHPRARLVPSEQETELGDSVSICGTADLGDRFALDGNPEMDLVGEAIHSFMAVDDYARDNGKRLTMAEKILHNWKVTAVTPENLVEASDRLRTHIEKTYGQNCIWLKEWPIHLRKGNQKANGWIDLLLETPAGLVIIDHKSFPGSKDRREAKALTYAPQLALYREAVEKATGKSVIATIIHMPVVGEMWELKI
jgi:ATP-dependent exoDNAse (exonuclease V) beta subunit